MSNIKLANSIFSRALSAARGKALPTLGTGASLPPIEAISSGLGLH